MKVAFVTVDNRDHFNDYEVAIPAFGSAPEALLQGFAELGSEVEIHVITCCHRPLHAPEKLAPNIWFHSLHIPQWGWMRSGFSGCIWASRKLLRQLQPDIVHGQGTERECGMIAAHSGFPNVITIHGNMRTLSKLNRERPFSPNWVAGKLEGRVLHQTNGIISISKYTEAMIEFHKRIWLIPNAVNTEFLGVKNTKFEDNRIVCIGVIQPRKNQLALIEALKPLAEKFPLQIRFFGRLPKNEIYGRKFLQAVAENAWCHYGGELKPKEICQELAQASLLVLPSLEDNCPMVLLEAMAAYVPVAASHVGGIPELIENNRNGWLFDPTNASKICSVIKEALTHQELRSEMVIQARRKIEEGYTPKLVASRHLQAYRELRQN